MFKFKSVTNTIPLSTEFINNNFLFIPKPEKEPSRFEKEAAIATYLMFHNVKVTIKCWYEWINKEGPGALTPYLKGLLTKMYKNMEKIEECFRDKRVSTKESDEFIRKIAEYYIETKGEFVYLFIKDYMDTFNSTMPDNLFGDSFLSLIVAHHYLDRNLLLTVERVDKIEEYKKFNYALKQWVKFYKEGRIIYPEQWLIEMIEEKTKQEEKQ